jgi:phenylpropionate dioxygenase-like ring-hydroxylating dioxygenase large terminal subunit
MNLKELIDEDRFGGVFRVHRSAFTSAEVALMEQANIFQRCWLYLGQIQSFPTPATSAPDGGSPSLGKRGSDGRARVFP